MKNFIKYTASSLMLALSILSCTKETTPERVNIQHPDDQSSIVRDDAYYARLRAYKQTNHKIAFGWYGTWTSIGPSYQTRISNCPDSMDIISIWSQWHSLTPEQAADKAFVQQVKGTKVTYTIFADKMPEPFISKEERDDPSKYTDERIEAFAKAYCKDSMDKWQYDGIDIDYEPGYGASGPFVGHDNELFKKLIIAMGQYVGPKSGTGRLFMIDGVPYAVHTEVADYFDYGIVQAYASYGYTDLQTRYNKADAKGWKPEQYIFAENFESYWEKGGVDHKTRDGQTVPSLFGMALFNPTQGEGAGFGAYHMEYEYAHSDMPYKFMRRAIQLVNPAPLGDYSKNLVSLNEAGISTYNVDVLPSGVVYGEVKCDLTGRLSIPAAADITIPFMVDNSLIDAYNRDNGTEYKAVETNRLTFSGSMNFAAKAQKSTEPVTATLNDLKTLDDGEYLIPIHPDLTGMEALGINTASFTKYLAVTKQTTHISVTVTGSATVPTFPVMQLFEGGYFGQVSQNISASLSHAANSAIEFGFEVDNDLVKTYNQKNGTSYQEVSPADVVLTGKLSVAQGAKSATGTVTLTVTNFDALKDGYSMIAVRPALSSLKDYMPDSKLGAKYIIIYKYLQNVNPVQTLEPFEDKCVKVDNTDNKLEWDFQIANLGSVGGTGVWNDGYISKMFDGDLKNGWYCIWNNYYSWPRNTGGRITLDMKEEVNVSTMRWYTYSGVVGKFSQILTSSDGTNWIQQSYGDVAVNDASIQWFSFNTPVKARYIRVVITDGPTGYTGWAEVDIWTPKAQ